MGTNSVKKESTGIREQTQNGKIADAVEHIFTGTERTQPRQEGTRDTRVPIRFGARPVCSQVLLSLRTRGRQSTRFCELTGDAEVMGAVGSVLTGGVSVWRGRHRVKRGRFRFGIVLYLLIRSREGQGYEKIWPKFGRDAFHRVPDMARRVCKPTRTPRTRPVSPGPGESQEPRAANTVLIRRPLA
jgi:hypothetical protein